jgi:hypothetical protein
VLAGVEGVLAVALADACLHAPALPWWQEADRAARPIAPIRTGAVGVISRAATIWSAAALNPRSDSLAARTGLIGQ